MESDFDIVEMIKNKDQTGLVVLDQRYAKQIFGVIYKIVEDEQQAVIILQDTFLKVWTKIDQYTIAKGRFLSWVFGIARNASIDWLRSKDHKMRSRISLVGQNYRIEPSVEGLFVDGIGVREMVSKLDTKYQLIIQKSYFEGYTFAEISKEFTIPLATVKSRARRAITLMKELMAENES